MKRTQLLTAAAILMACGCTESPAGPTYPISVIPPGPPEPVALTGTVSTDGSVSPVAVLLRLESGDGVYLVGSEAQRLTALDGAEIQVRGNWSVTGSPPLDTDISLDSLRQSFAVAEFVVLEVSGRPALDGILGKDEDLRTFYLKLSDGGVVWFADGRSDFDCCIGKRIWVTGSMENPPMVFGVIQ